MIFRKCECGKLGFTSGETNSGVPSISRTCKLEHQIIFAGNIISKIEKSETLPICGTMTKKKTITKTGTKTQTSTSTKTKRATSIQVY